MTFLAQVQLWWLGVLPVLYWLSLPPRPRRAAFTAHFAQWQAALAKLQRRPRQSALRFLCLATAALAAALAAAQPRLLGSDGPSRLIVLLDASASMAARTADGRTAFERATEQLRAGLAVLPPQVSVTLLACGRELRRRHGASARTLHDLGAPSGPLAVDLEQLAAASAAAGVAVWSLTDGQGQVALPSHGALSTFDTLGTNAAILAVRVDDRWPLPGLGVEVDVAAAIAAPTAAALHVSGAVATQEPQSRSLPPGVSTFAFELERLPAGGEVQFTIELPGDRLPSDDLQIVHLPPLPAPRVAALVDDGGGPFVTVAAEAIAAEVGGQVVPGLAGSEVELVLVDGGTVPLVAGRQRALTFGAALAGSDAVASVPWLEPRGVDWDRTAALTAGLDLSELRVQRALRNLLPAGEAFLWADDGGGRVPLAVVAGDAHLASVHFAFRLRDSNLPLLAAFPQLLRRAFVRCYGAGAALRVMTPPPTPGEQDLSVRATADDRPLPAFATEDRDLTPWCVLAGLLALVLRAFLR